MKANTGKVPYGDSAAYASDGRTVAEWPGIIVQPYNQGGQ